MEIEEENGERTCPS